MTGEPLDDVVATGWGLVYTPICALKSLTVEDAAAAFTRKSPPGTAANQWVYTDLNGEAGTRSGVRENWIKAVDGATEYPTQCPDHDDRHHFLVNC